MGKLANVTINNFCQVFISYPQVIRCYDMRSVPVHTKAFISSNSPFKIKFKKTAGFVSVGLLVSVPIDTGKLL